MVPSKNLAKFTSFEQRIHKKKVGRVGVGSHHSLLKFSLKSPCLWFGPQSHEILLNLGMKCWNVSNAQGSRKLQLSHMQGAVKIYVAAVEELKKMKRECQNRMKLTFSTKNW